MFDGHEGINLFRVTREKRGKFSGWLLVQVVAVASCTLYIECNPTYNFSS